MRKILDKFLWIAPGKPQNFLMLPFFIITLSYGIAFVFFGNTAPVTGTILYQLTVAQFESSVLSVWGVVAICVVLGSLIGIYLRKAWLGTAVSMGGFALWLYALFIYGMNGFILQVFALAVPNMLFWAWWYVLIKGYHRTYDE